MILCNVKYQFADVGLTIDPDNRSFQPVLKWLNDNCQNFSLNTTLMDYGNLGCGDRLDNIAFKTLEDYNLFKLVWSDMLMIDRKNKE